MIDAYKLAMVDKTKPLAAKSPATGFTCRICGAQQEPHTWRVTLPAGLGPSCLGCAGDRGFEVR